MIFFIVFYDRMKLIPLEDHILVEALIEETTSAGWFILPEGDKEKPSKGTVIAVWKGKILENGDRAPIDVKEGDIVFFTKYSPDELEVEGKSYLVVRHSSLLAVQSA